VLDAVGPERPTFLEMITEIRDTVQSRSRIQFVPGWMMPAMARLMGLALRDVLLTGDEYRAMAAGLADTAGPATGTTKLSTWLTDNAPGLGRSYANELNRHFQEAERAR
jgi:hypothetical protein